MLLTTHKNIYISSSPLRLPYLVQEAMMPLPRLAAHAHSAFLRPYRRARGMRGNVVSPRFRVDTTSYPGFVLNLAENHSSLMRIGLSDLSLFDICLKPII